MDWVDVVIKNLVGPVIGSAGVLSGLKFLVGRKAKQADLLDRLAKEIAVRNSLLKFKVAASEPNSPQLISAKEAAYIQAEELAALNPELAPEILWFGNGSAKDKFLPRRYDGQRRLTALGKIAWWGLFLVFYVGTLFYLLCGLGIVFLIKDGPVHIHKTKLLFANFLLLAFYAAVALWGSGLSRRKAYAVSLNKSFQKACEGL